MVFREKYYWHMHCKNISLIRICYEEIAFKMFIQIEWFVDLFADMFIYAPISIVLFTII